MTLVNQLLKDVEFLHSNATNKGAEEPSYLVFAYLYLAANREAIAAVLKHLYDKPEDDRRQNDPWPDDNAWASSFKTIAESAVSGAAAAVYADGYGDTPVSRDDLNMLSRALRIAANDKAFRTSPVRLFLSPAADTARVLQNEAVWSALTHVENF